MGRRYVSPRATEKPWLTYKSQNPYHGIFVISQYDTVDWSKFDTFEDEEGEEDEDDDDDDE